MSREVKTPGVANTLRGTSFATPLAGSTRAVLLGGLKKNGKSMLWLSQQLGKNSSYIQQFIYRGSPVDLDLADKIKIGELLGIAIGDLGIKGLELVHSVTLARTEVDAVGYEPPVGSILLACDTTISYWKTRTNVLNQHPMRIEPGDVLAIDLVPAPLARLKSEAVVLVECSDRAEGASPRLIIREFVRPALLTTNSTERNECFRIDDPALPFSSKIMGVCRSVIRSPDDA